MIHMGFLEFVAVVAVITIATGYIIRIIKE